MHAFALLQQQSTYLKLIGEGVQRRQNLVLSSYTTSVASLRATFLHAQGIFLLWLRHATRLAGKKAAWT